MTNDDLIDFLELVRLLRNNRHPNGLKTQAAEAISALMEENARLCADMETEKAYVACYQGIADKYKDEIIPGFRRRLDQVRWERDAAVADIEEILRTEHDTDICQYCDRTQHCVDYGCEASAKWRGLQKAE